MSLFVKELDGSLQLTNLSYICLILIIGIILITNSIKNGSSSHKFQTKQLVFAALALALAVVTSFIKVYTFPFGGSITLLSMFFVCFVGYLYGPYIGITTAIAFGLLQFIIGPYILYPLQVIIDYPLAFGALGFSGFFANQKNGLTKGYILGLLGRYFFATLSGVIFFGQYVWEGWNPLSYSLAYNGAYIFSEAIITLVIIQLPPVKKALESIKNMSIR